MPEKNADYSCKDFQDFIRLTPLSCLKQLSNSTSKYNNTTMDSPFLELLEPSKEKSSAIVLITGYISEGDFDEKAGKKWSQALRQAGWNGSIYKPIPLISKFELEST